MASIITPSNFIGDLIIANIGQANVQANVQNYIDKFEQEYLLNILGYTLKKKFETLQANSIYEDILNGKEYTNRFNILTEWVGFKYANGASPIASYIYCKYMQDQWSQTTGTGEKQLAAANATSVTPNWKIVKQWNWMVDRNRELVDFFLSNQDIYPEFVQYFESCNWFIDWNTYPFRRLQSLPVDELLRYANHIF